MLVPVPLIKLHQYDSEHLTNKVNTLQRKTTCLFLDELYNMDYMYNFLRIR